MTYQFQALEIIIFLYIYILYIYTLEERNMRTMTIIAYTKVWRTSD